MFRKLVFILRSKSLRLHLKAKVVDGFPNTNFQTVGHFINFKKAPNIDTMHNKQ